VIRLAPIEQPEAHTGVPGRVLGEDGVIRPVILSVIRGAR
jgi:hypothetical protein